jgi:hypothetical protein
MSLFLVLADERPDCRSIQTQYANRASLSGERDSGRDSARVPHGAARCAAPRFRLSGIRRVGAQPRTRCGRHWHQVVRALRGESEFSNSHHNHRQRRSADDRRSPQGLRACSDQQTRPNRWGRARCPSGRRPVPASHWCRFGEQTHGQRPRP